MDGIGQIADSISADLQHRLPRQRKPQRGKLALLVASMLDVRSANLMDLAAGLPLEADRTLVESWTFRLVGAPDLLLERTLMYNRLINAPTSVVGHDDLEMYERAQDGLRSRRYRPGPLSARHEPYIRSSLATYVALMDQA